MHLMHLDTILRLATCCLVSVPVIILWVTFWESWNSGGILSLRIRLARILRRLVRAGGKAS